MESRTLIINLGDIEGFATLTVQDRPEHCVLWHPVLNTPGADQRLEAARRQAALFAVDGLRIGRVMIDASDESPGAMTDDSDRDLSGTSRGNAEGNSPYRSEANVQDPIRCAHLLLLAALDARELGCTSIVIPWVAGEIPVDDAARFVEAQTLLARIIELGGANSSAEQTPTPHIKFQAPLYHLNDEETAELASRVAGFENAIWWCDAAADFPCGICESCCRWFTALDRAGVSLGSEVAHPA